ncbi:N-acetyltransferase [Kribbella pittospori]|uniref:N-acetyltransferase n=1 Tax=Kribbella pittospori TaxID=722689 RepID=A0A4R0K9Q6_9ACTN|nr:GNAT family N-acetyltransferase [Kribbella pittospori]TCC56449.1 N-acetyltransferase [Kribbella pittospori]
MVDVLHKVEPDRLPELLTLFHSAWWMSDRTLPDTECILRESDIVFALADPRLTGFARVLTDYTHIALILDVVVSPHHRTAGHGTTLMNAIVNHPRLQTVRSLELVCQPDLIPFYRRWGFTTEVGQSLLMRRTNDPRLTS